MKSENRETIIMFIESFGSKLYLGIIQSAACMKHAAATKPTLLGHLLDSHHCRRCYIPTTATASTAYRNHDNRDTVIATTKFSPFLPSGHQHLHHPVAANTIPTLPTPLYPRRCQLHPSTPVAIYSAVLLPNPISDFFFRRKTPPLTVNVSYKAIFFS